MDILGITLCSRYAYPPNSFSLCGPDKPHDLSYYSTTGVTDKGNKEILSQFSTLYPYLCLIAQENKIKDPFQKNVVEAYWVGNRLLENVRIKPFANHLSDSLKLKKKMKRNKMENIFIKLLTGGLPHHAFHVLNIYKRTGNLDIPHTIETMDACLINFGQVIKINGQTMMVKTQKLISENDFLGYSLPITREIRSQGKKDRMIQEIKAGDLISYHWGMFCEKLNLDKAKNLTYYNNLSIKLANLKDVQ